MLSQQDPMLTAPTPIDKDSTNLSDKPRKHPMGGYTCKRWVSWKHKILERFHLCTGEQQICAYTSVCFVIHICYQPDFHIGVRVQTDLLEKDNSKSFANPIYLQSCLLANMCNDNSIK